MLIILPLSRPGGEVGDWGGGLSVPMSVATRELRRRAAAEAAKDLMGEGDGFVVGGCVLKGGAVG